MLNVADAYYYRDEFDSFGNFTSSEIEEENDVRFALGFSVGGKFVLKNGFTTEVFLGVVRNLLGQRRTNYYSDTNLVSRGGVSFGYRF